MSQYFVTGANGFVGGHLCERLLSQGHSVWGLVRNIKKIPFEHKNFHCIQGSLSAGKAHSWLGELPPELDGVIHTAGIVHSFDLEVFKQINGLATKQLIEDFAANYPQLRFTYISSLAAAGPSSTAPQVEESPCRPVSVYGQSKLDGEKFLQHLAPADWITTIIRPPMVIGPRDPAFLDLVKMVARGLVFAPGSDAEKKLYSFVYVDDLVQTIIKSLNHPTNNIFYSASPQIISMDQLINEISNALKKKRPPVIKISDRRLKIASKIVYVLNKFTGINPRLTPDKYFELKASAWTCSSEKAQKALGVNFEWDIEKALLHTIQWYRDQKLIK